MNLKQLRFPLNFIKTLEKRTQSHLRTLTLTLMNLLFIVALDIKGLRQVQYYDLVNGISVIKADNPITSLILKSILGTDFLAHI